MTTTVTRDLVIKNCDEKFVDMVKNIHRVLNMRIKCGIQINLSGNPEDFTYLYLNLHPDNATKVVKYEELTSEKKDGNN